MKTKCEELSTDSTHLQKLKPKKKGKNKQKEEVESSIA